VRRHEEVEIEPVGSGRRKWRWLLLLLLLVALAVGSWKLLDRMRRQAVPVEIAQATDVRSAITQRGDSLEVVVAWQVTSVPGQGVAESIRVEVGTGEGVDPRVRTHSAERRTDTLQFGGPARGETISGYSCVSAVHRGRLTRESCTPWQFVRPEAAAVDTAPPPKPGQPKPAAAGPAKPSRVVVHPEGLQVDPDAGGKCAAWQRRNPGQSVWVEVNQRAVEDCTGPNGKPTVAQFCAFAVLPDGRRVKTENSRNDPYCERLFQEWTRERIS